MKRCSELIFFRFRSSPELLDLIEGLRHEHDDNPIYCRDISYGKELLPIPLHAHRSMSKDKLPQFSYVRKCVFPAGVSPTLSMDQFVQCCCVGGCRPEICACRREGSRSYNSDGLLAMDKLQGEYYSVFECNETCLCGPDCGNRVAQKGLQCLVRIQKASKRKSSRRNGSTGPTFLDIFLLFESISNPLEIYLKFIWNQKMNRNVEFWFSNLKSKFKIKNKFKINLK